jgi:hypothetical protein
VSTSAYSETIFSSASLNGLTHIFFSSVLWVGKSAQFQENANFQASPYTATANHPLLACLEYHGCDIISLEGGGGGILENGFLKNVFRKVHFKKKINIRMQLPDKIANKIIF